MFRTLFSRLMSVKKIGIGSLFILQLVACGGSSSGTDAESSNAKSPNSETPNSETPITGNVQPHDRYDAPKACGYNKTETVDLGDRVFDSGILDAEGRHLRYRYKLPDDYNANNEYAVSLYFHGNSDATQTEILGRSSLATENNPVQGQMIKIVLASPDTRSNGTTRQWDYAKDAELLDVLLHNDFSCQININPEKIFMRGGSQGACFLNSYLGSYGNNLEGGGVFSECGCSDSLNQDWIPSQKFKENFRVFVASTKDDFLHDSAITASQYYRNHARLDLFAANTEEAGQHCQSSADTRSRAWRFVTNSMTEEDKLAADVQPYPQSIKWNAVSQLPAETYNHYSTAFNISSQNELITAVYDSGNDRTTVYKTGSGDMQWSNQGSVPKEVISIHKKANQQWYVTVRNKIWNDERTRYTYNDAVFSGDSIDTLAAFDSRSATLWSGNSETVFRAENYQLYELNSDAGSGLSNWLQMDYYGRSGSSTQLSMSSDLAEKQHPFFYARNATLNQSAYSLFSENTFGDIEKLSLPAGVSSEAIGNLKGQRIDNSILLAGNAGTDTYHVYYSSNNAGNWAKLVMPDAVTQNRFSEVVLLPNQGVLALSGSKMFYSPNGRDWENWQNFLYGQNLLLTKDGRLLSMASRTLYQATFY